MLFRKIRSKIKDHFLSHSDKILMVEGARQVGKSYIIRNVGSELFVNLVEINLIEDKERDRLFENVRSVEDFYLQLSMIAGDRLGSRNDTLIFLDEIQAYPHLLTMLKFLRQDAKFTYVASGSLLGLSHHRSTSVPIGSIELLKMYPLDFEEFLIANNVGKGVIGHLHERYLSRESPEGATHRRILDLFRKYLLVGGMPDTVDNILYPTYPTPPSRTNVTS